MDALGKGLAVDGNEGGGLACGLLVKPGGGLGAIFCEDRGVAEGVQRIRAHGGIQWLILKAPLAKGNFFFIFFFFLFF